MRNVSELDGVDLDYWVARAAGEECEIRNGIMGRSAGAPHEYQYVSVYVLTEGYGLRTYDYSPSTSWGQGGSIIERERIQLEPRVGTEWTAYCRNDHDELIGQIGGTPLVAAMRAYVVSKFGGEVNE